MLNQIRFCSRSTAVHGTSVKQSRAVSVAVSAAAVAACTATNSPATEVTSITIQSHNTSCKKQFVHYLAVPEQHKTPDLNAALFKASQRKHAAGRAERTKTATPESRKPVFGSLRESKEQQTQQLQDAAEQQAAGTAGSVAGAHPHQRHQGTHMQMQKQKQQQQQHSRHRRNSWTPYHDKLLRELRQRPDLLPAGSRVLVAVSGGQDSMALLRLLSDLNTRKHWPLQLIVAHCDHNMRPDSADNAAFVQQIAEQLGLECHVRTAKQELRGEDAARKWRLSNLQGAAQQTGCSCYVLGHTATDRAETLLFNLVRGAGAAGLSSMGWEREVLPGLRQVRPLLWMDRADTAAFCEATSTQVWEDSTNNDQTFAARNLLRLSVFPHLLGINAKAVQHIAIASELLEAEDGLLRSLAKQQLQLAEVKYMLQPQLQQQSQTEAAGSAVGETSAVAAAGVAAQYTLDADAVSGQTSTSRALAIVAAASSAVQVNSLLLPDAAFDAAAVSCMPDMFKSTTWHRNMPAVSQAVQATAAQRRKLQRQAASCAVAAGQTAGTALDIRALSRCPAALRSRVIWMWLQQQLKGAPTYLMVQEVLWLLLPRKGNGATTGTLLDSCCVTRQKLPHSGKQLLLLVDVAAANQLHSGQLKLRVESPDVCSGITRKRRALQQLLFSLEAQPREYAEQQGLQQVTLQNVEVSDQGVAQATRPPTSMLVARLQKLRPAMNELQDVQHQQPMLEFLQAEQEQKQQHRQSKGDLPKMYRSRRQWQQWRLQQQQILGYRPS